MRTINKAGMAVSDVVIDILFAEDLAAFERGVEEAVKVPLSEDQFAALVAFSFNVGLGAFRTSTLLKLLNRGDYQGAADQLPRWNKSGGKVLNGLVKRRASERALFLGQQNFLPMQYGLFGEPIADQLAGVVVDQVVDRGLSLLLERLISWLVRRLG